MAAAFSQHERLEIDKKLIAAAHSCAAAQGMKHATIDALARKAGISKGAFYSFYKSKEALFLALLTRMHEDMYGGAARILEKDAALPPDERAARAISEVFKVYQSYGLSGFMQEDLPLLLRRLPDSLLRGHYRDDEQHIRELIAASGVTLTCDADTACQVLRFLLFLPIFKRDIGDSFSAAFEILVKAACRELIAG